MNRENLNWEALAAELRALIGDTTPETAVKVEVRKNTRNVCGLVITPANTNTSNAFYHTEALVDFCRCKKLSNWIGTLSSNTIEVHIY